MPRPAKSIRPGDIVVVIRDGLAMLGECVYFDGTDSPPVWRVRVFLNGERVDVHARQVFKVYPQSSALRSVEVLS